MRISSPTLSTDFIESRRDFTRNESEKSKIKDIKKDPGFINAISKYIKKKNNVKI